MDLVTDDIIKLLLAIALGGLIGAEREYRDKAAGFRTIIFICVGSTLFTMMSHKLANNSDPARIAAQIVSGVGFLGAGAILRDQQRVKGLTTAATIWLAAALGMGIGGGYYLLATVTVGFMLVVLWMFPFLERWIDNVREMRTYHVECAVTPGLYDELDALIRSCGVRVFEAKRVRAGDTMRCTWLTYGAPKRHDAVAEHLFEHPGVVSFDF